MIEDLFLYLSYFSHLFPIEKTRKGYEKSKEIERERKEMKSLFYVIQNKQGFTMKIR